MIHDSLLAILFAVTLPMQTVVEAKKFEANFDESKVGEYTLPDPLVTNDGRRVTSPEMWRDVRRPELLRWFETDVYGRMPPCGPKMHVELVESSSQALDGRATRKQLKLTFGDSSDAPSMNLLIYLPNGASRRVPMFVGLNFNGNQAVQSDPAIVMSTSWMRPSKDKSVVDHRATEATRGVEASRWPVELVISRGYGVATVYYGDIDPDFDDGFKNGVHTLFDPPDESPRAGDRWGSIGAWSWGLSRVLDYLETDKDIDAKHVAVLGHSRLGKTALWAGACDERFAIVISNDSGCGGAALSRRIFGETVGKINTSFPHWFCDNFKKFDNRENELPVDQHELIALMAPRPVYVASAEEDRWADPRGEFLSALAASPVYKLMGTDGLGVDEMPPVSQSVMSTIGYHIRPGKHDINEYDWRQYLDFADRHFAK